MFGETNIQYLVSFACMCIIYQNHLDKLKANLKQYFSCTLANSLITLSLWTYIMLISLTEPKQLWGTGSLCLWIYNYSSEYSWHQYLHAPVLKIKFAWLEYGNGFYRYIDHVQLLFSFEKWMKFDLVKLIQ